MDPNDINGLAFKHAFREILNPVGRLRSRDAAAYDGNVGGGEVDGGV